MRFSSAFKGLNRISYKELTLVVLAQLVETPHYKAEGCGFDFG